MLDDKQEKTSISITTNLADKQRATKIFNSLGLNLSTAINIFLKKSIAEGGLPFEVKDPFYSEANQAELNRRFKKVSESKDIYPHQLSNDK
ncbi:MAG: type II toxin-antitoxin system RelB/DinJ family antitoxin [Lentilactobacillus diolivorans]|jgi:DNA-damage-inducible protein J|nr:type II toxin-antitoxin system RelB/DinJ family antitoxin [Lentilactobacillus diolivorans]RRG03778.1 MAG: type II toxin-antitoxin system RelB/DinJ family antitoxin [Lactobacillus sp.]